MIWNALHKYVMDAHVIDSPIAVTQNEVAVSQSDASGNEFLNKLFRSSEPTAVDVKIQSYDERVTAEINSFKREKQLSRTEGNIHSNPLHWWRDNQFEYPILSSFARKILYIPATPAPLERVFSAAGLTITDRRASLHGELSASQVLLHQLYTPLQKYGAGKRKRLQQDD